VTSAQDKTSGPESVMSTVSAPASTTRRVRLRATRCPEAIRRAAERRAPVTVA